MTLGDKIKALREYKKLEAKALAAELNIPIDSLSKYEVGKLPNPTLETLLSFGDAMGVSIDYFVSNYSPEKFILRQKLIDTADKISMLPDDIRRHYEDLIQHDYNKYMLELANDPVHIRRRTKSSFAEV